MKKIFSFAIVLMVLVTALGFNVGIAKASVYTPPTPTSLPPRIFLNSPYFDDLGSGTKVPAQMFAESNFKNVYCVTTNVAGQVTCEFPEKYANQSVTLYLTVGDQVLIFYIDVPKMKEVRGPF